MNQMTDEEFETTLKQMPCPACGEIGHLVTQQMEFKLNYKGYPVAAEGEGWVCMGGCGQKFMSDDLTEQLANQTSAIDEGGQTIH
jgi:hypothetical protein